MAGRLIDATLTWFRTCSTRMFCMWFQFGYLDFTHLFQQQRFTICGCTSYTMLCLQPCLSFGSPFSIGNMISRRTLMTLSCTESVSTMCSSASQCFGVGLCMLVGRASYCSWFVSLLWTRHKSNSGKLEGWLSSATLCFALWLWLSTSSCWSQVTSIPFGPYFSFSDLSQASSHSLPWWIMWWQHRPTVKCGTHTISFRYIIYFCFSLSHMCWLTRDFKWSTLKFATTCRSGEMRLIANYVRKSEMTKLWTKDVLLISNVSSL